MSIPANVRVHHGQVRIIDSDGNRKRRKLANVLKHRGTNGDFNERGIFVFHQRSGPKQAQPAPAVRHSPAFGPAVQLPAHYVSDSGFSVGRYPLFGLAGMRETARRYAWLFT